MCVREKGILLLAFGHPYYGRQAYNLAVSIKAEDPQVHVTVAFTPGTLNHIHSSRMDVFDDTIELPSRIKPNFGAKLYLDDLTPYKYTLYLDVDTVWLPGAVTPTRLLDELASKDVIFTAPTEGRFNYGTGEDESSLKYYYWADRKEIAEKYNITEGFIYQWRSEVMFFEDRPEAQKFFTTARKVYQDPGLNSIKKFAATIPDELGINVSAAIHKMNPHVFKWQPTYWPALNNFAMPAIPALAASHYLLSCGGHAAEGGLRKLYDRIMGTACRKLGVQHLFSLHSKNQYLPERSKL